MRRLIFWGFLLSVVVLLSACAGGNGTPRTAVPLADLSPEYTGTCPLEGRTVAFSVTSPLCGAELRCVPESKDASFTVSVYAADRDVKISLAAEPLRTVRVTDPSEDFLWMFRTLPAGDYLIRFSQVSGVAAVSSAVPSEQANGKILQYRGTDVLSEGPCALTLLVETKDDADASYLTSFAYPVPVEDGN